MDETKCEKMISDSVIIAPVGSGKTNWSKYLASRCDEYDEFVYFGGESNAN